MVLNAIYPTRTWAIMALNKFNFFIISERQWFIGKDSEKVSCYVHHSFKLRIFIFIDWLPPKARKLSLFCYLNHIEWEKKWNLVFPKDISLKWTQQTRLEVELELSMQVSLSTLITMTFHTHPATRIPIYHPCYYLYNVEFWLVKIVKVQNVLLSFLFFFSVIANTFFQMINQVYRNKHSPKSHLHSVNDIWHSVRETSHELLKEILFFYVLSWYTNDKTQIWISIREFWVSYMLHCWVAQVCIFYRAQVLNW